VSKALPALPAATKKRIGKALKPHQEKALERRASLMKTAQEKESRIKVLAVCGYATETIARLIGASIRDFEPGGIWYEVHQDAVQEVMEDVMAAQIALAINGDDKAADRLIRRHLVGFDKQPAAPGAQAIELHLNFQGSPAHLVNGKTNGAALPVIEGSALSLIGGNA